MKLTFVEDYEIEKFDKAAGKLRNDFRKARFFVVF